MPHSSSEVSHCLMIGSIRRYSTLESSGALRSILNNPELDATRPLFDEDLQRAIEALNTSTAAIQRQTEILTSQCESINKHMRMEDEMITLQSRDIERLRQKHDSGRQAIMAAVRASKSTVVCTY
jgi:septal ring factor EnvC (AmiA/AmiB activator)